MKREKYLEKLVVWKNDPHRKPLILEGARQVGKTWLMQEFAKIHFRNVVYLRFDKNATLRRIFASDFDVTRILCDLDIFAHTRIDAANTILRFDEIQACKVARPRAFIAAGKEREEAAAKEKLFKNVGRNDPCPFDSGLKFKKCCDR